MMNIRTVKSVRYSPLNKCNFIQYEKEPGQDAFAAIAEHLSVKVGQDVWIFSDDFVHYKGFSAVAVLVA